MVQDQRHKIINLRLNLEEKEGGGVMPRNPCKYEQSKGNFNIKISRREGDVLPSFFYGLAYFDYVRDFAVFMPIPINYVVRLGKRIKHKWDKFRSRPSWVDKQVRAEIKRREQVMTDTILNDLIILSRRIREKINNDFV